MLQCYNCVGVFEWCCIRRCFRAQPLSISFHGRLPKKASSHKISEGLAAVARLRRHVPDAIARLADCPNAELGWLCWLVSRLPDDDLDVEPRILRLVL